MEKRPLYLRGLSIFMACLLVCLLYISVGTPVVEASSLTSVTNLNIVFSDDASSGVAINWRTSSAGTADMSVVYAAEGESLTASTAQRQAGEQLVHSSQTFYKSKLSNLQPGTNYRYAIVNDITGDMTPEYSFRTADTQAETFQFVAVPSANYRSTSSYQNCWNDTLKSALTQYPNTGFVLHTGPYGSSTDEQHWNGFFDTAKDTLPNIPLIPVANDVDNGNRYFARNFNIETDSKSNANDYAVIYGDLLMLVVNTKLRSTSDIKSHQAWIADQISDKAINPETGNKRWIIVSMSESFYGTASNTLTFKRDMEKIFEDSGVNLVIQGNENLYSRSYPIKSGEANVNNSKDYYVEEGVIYLTPGTAGAEYGSPSSTSRKWIASLTSYNSSSASRRALENKTYTGFEVSADALTVNAYTQGGAQVDSFTISRELTSIPETPSPTPATPSPTPATPSPTPATPSPNPAYTSFSPYGLNNGFGSDAYTTRVISWQSDANAGYGAPSVIYTNLSTGERFEQDGVTTTLTTVTSGKKLHRVTLEGLVPGTTYSYQIVNADAANSQRSYISAKTYSFSTASDSEFTFLHMSNVYSGSQSEYSNNWKKVLDTALENTPNSAFLVTSGKLVSSNSSSNWGNFWGATNDALASTAFIPVANSNEASSSSSGAYLGSIVNVAGNELRDSAVVYGDALVLTLNTKYKSSSNQTVHANWIRQQVKSHGTNPLTGEKRWVIVAISDSFYNNSGSQNSSSIKKELQPVFNEVGVAMVLQGEDNAYVRSQLIDRSSNIWEYPNDKEFATKDGIIYVTSGTVGQENSRIRTESIDKEKGWIYKSLDFYTNSADKKDINKKMYAQVTVNSDEIVYKAYTVDGVLQDSFTIHRGKTPEPNVRELSVLGLNNNFGNDARYTRNIAWQTEYDQYMGDFKIVLTNTKTGEVTEKTVSSQVFSNVLSSGKNKRSSHKVALTVEPDTTYTYKIQAARKNSRMQISAPYETKEYSFSSGPSENESFTFIHFADSQGDTSKFDAFWGNTLRSANKKYPDAAFAIHTGDMIDSNGSDQWVNFFNAMGDEFSGKAFLPVPGNHEGDTGATFAMQAFALQKSEMTNFDMNYAFTYGNAVFINLNTNKTSSSNIRAQKTWLEQLKKDVIKDDMFVIVSLHRGPFKAHHGGVSEIRDNLLPTFHDIGVDLVLMGHDHQYARSFPMQNATPNKNGRVTVDKFGTLGSNDNPDNEVINTDEDGIVYMIARNSGQKTYSYKKNLDWTQVTWDFTNYRSPADYMMYSAVTVEADKIIVKATLANGQVYDAFTIVQNATAKTSYTGNISEIYTMDDVA